MVVWAGEFAARHSHRALTAAITIHLPFRFGWPGAACAGGTTYGETDEFGYKVVDKKVEMHDLHATILYQLGIDHERLTYRFGGRDHRLTDVHGHVIKEILA